MVTLWKKSSVAVQSRKRGTVKYRRRKNRKNRKQLANRNSVPVGLGFPKRMVMTHKYCDQIKINTAALGAFYAYSFSTNGMYDPNSTGIGHQPMYFDQMTAIYNHYTVIGSQIIIRATKTDAQPDVATTVGAYINDDGTVVPTTLSALLEQSNAKHRILHGNKPTTTFKMKWSAKKTFAGSILGNDNLIGTSAANPTESQAFTFFLDSSAGVTVTTVTLDVEIRYIAVWTELKDIESS